MSTTIDQRVVEMRFDNKHFENNVQTSLSTLDRLKQKLNLTGAAQGLENIGAAARKVDFSGMSNGIQTVQAKFSYMQATIQHQINNMVDSAVRAGKRMASALTIDPIKSGFSEYETQINAVQTILANTSHAGTDINDVNKALDELNLYADKTIYNFTEMTRNIGTFTAAGLGLEESTAAIKGIANLAAVSGSTSHQASTAMYQLSQALANGKVNLQDWNSVVNAGMGGKVFQDALVRTAAAMKGVSEETFRANNITGSFRESISSRDGGGWLTAEVLSSTLQQFTGDMTDAELAAQGFTEEQIKNIQAMGVTANDAATKVKTATQLWDTLKESAQSGWSQTWKTVVGDFEEAKVLWTGVSDVIGGFINASAESRNNLLSGALDTNWEKMVSTIINKAGIESSIFEEKLRSTMESHKLDVDALIEKHGSLYEVFKSGAVSSDILQEAVAGLSSGLADLSKVERTLEKGHEGDDVKQIQEVLKGLGHDIGAAGVDGSFGKDTQAAVKAFQELKGLEVTGIVDDKTLEALKEASKSTLKLTSDLRGLIAGITEMGGREKLIASLKNIFEGLVNVAKPIRDAFREIFPPLTVNQVSNFIDKFQELSVSFKEFTGKHADQIKSAFMGLFSVVDIGWTAIKELAGGIAELIGHLFGFSGSILDSAASFGDWLTGLRNTVKETDIFGTAVGNIVGFLGTCITKIKEFGSSIKESLGTPDYEGFVGFFKGLGGILSGVGIAIGKALGSVGKIISDIVGKGDIFEAINSGLLTAIVINITKFTKSFGAAGDIMANVKGILDDVRGCFEAYQNQLKAGTLLKIAAAVGILAAALYVISTIDGKQLGASLGAITVMFAELMGSLALLGGIDTSLKGMVKATGMMIGMSVSILILAGALKMISSIGTSGIIDGVLAIGVLMAELSLFLMAAKLDGKITSSAFGIILLSSALLILAKAVKSFGEMGWNDLGKGLTGLAVSLGILMVALNMIPKNWTASFDKFGSVKASSNLISTGIALIAMATAMKILASAVKDFGSLEWSEIGKGLLTMAGAVGILVLAVRAMPKNMLGSVSGHMVGMGVGIIAMAAAMKILASAVKDFGSLEWNEIGKGLLTMGVALAELAIGLNFMKNSMGGSVALLVAAGALAIIAPTLKSLGEMSVGSIVKSLVSLAAAFAVIGIAAALLQPVLPAILGLAGAMALIGVATALVGAGLLAVSAGISALGVGLAAGATAIVSGLTVIIVGIINLIPAIAKAIGEGIVEICTVIGDCAPQVAESALKLISEVLRSLATYTPQIVDSLLVFLIGVLNTLSEHMPELIQAAMNFIGSLFQGIVDALNGIDTTNLLKGVAAVGLMTGLMYALSGVGALVPGAMAGLIGVGLVIAEMALVLGAVGALAQIPGLQWLVEEGGNLLEKIGTAIGQFVGGLAGGIAKGFTSSLPEIATDLSNFMTNVQPFVDGIKSIDASILEGAASLAGAIVLITAADMMNGIASFLTGGSSLTDFATQLQPFGEAMLVYSNTVSGIDANAVTASATAAKALSELANGLPNSGGLAGFFAGENDLSSFATQLVPFGEAMTAYSKSIVGLDAAAVVSSANAAKALAELANNVPNAGGLASLFTGENSLSSFGSQLPAFGMSMRMYAMAVAGIDAEAVISSANAAKALAELAANLPNSGGLVSLFSGENSLSAFGGQIVSFGGSMRQYAMAVTGINPEAVIASANAAKSLSELASNLPNSGGLVALFTGENSLSSFGSQLAPFGQHMRNYADTITGINPEAVIASANAAKALSELATNLPNSGGLVALFSGDNSLSTFGDQLAPFGRGMKSYSDAVTGIDADAVIASANAAKSLSELATNLPNSGGLVALFTGENSLADLGDQLTPFGKSIKSYADAVVGIDAGAVSASANAAKSLSELATNLPNSGGLVSLFAGENDLGKFGSKLVPLGEGLKSYSDAVVGIDAGAIKSSASAAGDIAKLVDDIAGIDIYGVDSFVSAINTLGTAQVDTFVSAFDGVPQRMTAVGLNIVDSLVGSVQSKAPLMHNAATSLLTSFTGGITINKAKLTTTTTSMVDIMVKTIMSKQPMFRTQGMKSIDSFIKGITTKRTAVISALTSVLAAAITNARSYYSNFYSAGSHLVTGFTNGISANSYKASAKARAMALAAKEAAEEALGIQSPSKVFYKIGDYAGQGLVNALGDYNSKTYEAGSTMADYAKRGLSNALSQIQDTIDSDLDTQPTIRPVLDLTNVQSGAAAISGLFGNGVSVDTLSNVRSIGSMVNSRIQNGTNNDVISAINKLGASLATAGGDTYIMDGITYDDGSNISNAMKEIVREARMERRR